MKSEFDLRGGKIMTGYKVTLKEHNFKLIHSTGNFIAKQFINDKWAESDRINGAIGSELDYAMIPLWVYMESLTN